MTLSDLAKYSMTRSIARPLCDGRATCTSKIMTALKAQKTEEHTVMTDVPKITEKCVEHHELLGFA